MHLRMLFLFVLLALGLPLRAQTPTPHIPWDGQSRFTLLVLGMDRRPGARDTLSVRTDVMMIVSLDPASSRIGILHIPRDTHFVPRGSGDFLRANTLLVEGEKLAAGYGPAFAMETLWYNLGIHIDGYIAVDFVAFINLIDLVGGIDVDVPYAINDPEFPDMNYGYEPLAIPAGRNHFDGRTALKYVRTRHGDSDFERGQRQIQVVMALRDRILDTGVLPQLLANADALYADFRANLYTDLSLNELIRLALYSASIAPQHIRTGGIDRDHTIEYRLRSGEIALIPRGDSLYALLTAIFGVGY